MRTEVYPIIIRMNSKDIQIGSAKVEFSSGSIINKSQREHEATLRDIKLNFKVGDWIDNVLCGR